MAKKKLPTAQAAEIKEHRSAWGKIQRVIPEKEGRRNESLCDTVVRLIKERNAAVKSEQIDNRYFCDGLPVQAESARHAVKYYCAVMNRPVDYVVHNGKWRAVSGRCENTGLGIFCDDLPGVHYHEDGEGIMWLAGKEMKAMSKLPSA